MPVATHHDHVFDKHWETPVDLFRLWNVSHDVFFERLFDRATEQLNLPLSRGDKSHDRLKQRRLPGTVNTHQRSDRPSWDFKRCIPQRSVTITISNGHILYLNPRSSAIEGHFPSLLQELSPSPSEDRYMSAQDH